MAVWLRLRGKDGDFVQLFYFFIIASFASRRWVLGIVRICGMGGLGKKGGKELCYRTEHALLQGGHVCLPLPPKRRRLERKEDGRRRKNGKKKVQKGEVSARSSIHSSSSSSSSSLPLRFSFTVFPARKRTVTWSKSELGEGSEEWTRGCDLG
ncbi:hypothetical protein IE53DRAFT_45311 [Violaceomyces palustris]|uniref:Uncharacterized protein n=1 Tax=Violaceomyces palustris TaxID=1673888 RepID=A0ACD0P0H7_9BASI|nr:hypothetical protein IE53DRAFT_45311 [Violaceomyces palustris]